MTWIVVLLIAFLVALPFVLEALRKEVDESMAPGKFADLPCGRTHYRWLGPVRGPVVVCVHGLTTSSPIWEEVAEALGETAFRVLVYDLPGRGYSQSVPGRQDDLFFVRQLEQLLEHLVIREDISLVGYSMGGAIVTAYAAKHPEQIQRVIQLAPSGIEREPTDGYAALRLKPFVGEWLARVVEPILARRRLNVQSPFASSKRADYARQGFFPSVLSSRRGLLTQSMEREHRLLHREGIPVLAVWGGLDDVTPIRGMGTLAQWNRAARQEQIPDADHRMPETHGREVVELIRAMMRERA